MYRLTPEGSPDPESSCAYDFSHQSAVDDALSFMEKNDIPSRPQHSKPQTTTGPIPNTPSPKFARPDNMASSDPEDGAGSPTLTPKRPKKEPRDTDQESEVDLDRPEQPDQADKPWQSIFGRGTGNTSTADLDGIEPAPAEPEQEPEVATHKARRRGTKAAPASKQATVEDAVNGDFPSTRHRSTSSTIDDHGVAQRAAQRSLKKRGADIPDPQSQKRQKTMTTTTTVKSETLVQEDMTSSMEDIPEAGAQQQSTAAAASTQQEDDQVDIHMDDQDDQDEADDEAIGSTNGATKTKTPKPAPRKKNGRGSKTPSAQTKSTSASASSGPTPNKSKKSSGGGSSMLKKIKEDINNRTDTKILISSSDILSQPHARAILDFLNLQGLTIIDDVPARRTEFVCIIGDQIKTTAKVLRSLAQGKLVVTEQWIEDSLKKGHMCDPRVYIHPDVTTTIDIDRSGLFEDQTLFFTTALKTQYGNGWTSIQNLARELGATAVEFGTAKKGSGLGEDVVFFGKDKGDGDVAKLIDHGCEVFHKDMLTQSVIDGFVDFNNPDWKLSARKAKKSSKSKKG